MRGSDDAFAVSLDDLQRSLGAGPATDGLVEIFLTSLDDDAQQLRPLLKTANRNALRQWVHRTGGALALLRSPFVDAEMQAFRHAIHSAADADLGTAGERVRRLLAHLQRLMATLETANQGVVHRTQVTDS